MNLTRAARRHFRMVVGLREGYAPAARLHTVQDVTERHGEWQQSRAFVLGAIISEATASYAWTLDYGEDVVADTEAVAVLEGTANPLYHAHISDGELLDRLVGLALYLGECLHQSRVYLEWLDDALVVELDPPPNQLEVPIPLADRMRASGQVPVHLRIRPPRPAMDREPGP